MVLREDVRGFKASRARLRVSQGRTALRSVAHSAMRPHRGAAPSSPVCPPREHVAPRPLRRIALSSVLLERKTIPPLHPSFASGRAVCLLVSGKPTVKTHTHERGSISSGWPPNQPASRIAKLFGEVSSRGEGTPVRWVARRVGRRARKTFAPGKPAAAPSLTRADSETRRTAMPPHSRGGRTLKSGERPWLTSKRTPTRPSSFSG